MKRRANKYGAFSIENKAKPVYQTIQDSGFSLKKWMCMICKKTSWCWNDIQEYFIRVLMRRP